MKALVLSILAAATLAACGGGNGNTTGGTTQPTQEAGGSNDATGTKLSGTAAGGAPLVGTVTAKDSLGATKMADIAEDGSYKIDITGMTGPFMLRATGTVGGTSVTYYSAATAADLDKTVNVTPFTSVIISNIAAKLAETYYNEGNFSASITSGSLNAAIGSLQQKLAPALQALGLSTTIDLLRQSFTTDHTGLDAALDLIKVSIDPATNVATLKNAVTNTTIAEDNLNNKLDDAAAIKLNDVEKQTLGTAQTDMQQVQTVLNQFAALFGGSALPTIQQLQNSGVFDTSSAFVMGGGTFTEFANDVTTEPFLLGIRLASSDLVFSPTNPNVLRAKVRLTLKNGVNENIDFTLARASVSSPWKITGNGRNAHINVDPRAVYNLDNVAARSLFTAGIQFDVEVDQYNTNHPSAPITSATISGPGITGAIQVTAKDGIPYLVLNGTESNMILECQGSAIANCINIGAMTDNGSYLVRLFAGSTSVSGPLEGYRFTISKKPVPSSALSASMFPNLTSVTIDGNAVTQLSEFQANKNLSVSWTMPATVHQDGLSLNIMKGTNPIGSAGRETIEADLVSLGTSTKLLALGSAPVNATWMNIWLSSKDIYGRGYVLSRQYPSN